MGHEAGGGSAHDRDGDGLQPLGPPGWEEFQAARRRFEASLGLLGIEQASPRPAPERRWMIERELPRAWR